MNNFNDLKQQVIYHVRAQALPSNKISERCDAQRRSATLKKKNLSRIMAGVRTLTTIILSQTNCQNKKAQLENFSDDFGSLIVTLNTLNFL